MMRILLLMFVLMTLFFSWGCEDIENPTMPGRPVMVPKSLPWEYKEKGIDADDKVTGIFVEWYRNPEPEMEGYIVYRAADTSESRELTFVRADTVFAYPLNPTLSDTEYVDTDVTFGTMYYYYIRALDISENKSIPSDTVRYTLTPRPGECLPDMSEQAQVKPEFSWKYSNDFQYGINYYYIRVENLTTRESVWFYGVPRLDYTGQGQIVKYDIDGNATEPALSSAYTYRWKVDAIGRQDSEGYEIEGSESRWITFQVED
jgi:hypothetical protein